MLPSQNAEPGAAQAEDIEERSRNSEDLRTARQQLVDAIESISEGFALFDRDERYILTNSTYTRCSPISGGGSHPARPIAA
jgi:PAS domain-containing protein